MRVALAHNAWIEMTDQQWVVSWSFGHKVMAPGDKATFLTFVGRAIADIRLESYGKGYRQGLRASEVLAIGDETPDRPASEPAA